MKKFKNIGFSIHYSFLIFFLLCLFVGLGGLVLMYFICLLIHEGMHAFIAKRRGYKIGKIKLMATGAVLEAESDEFSFSDEIIIALAGPLINLVLVLLLIVCWWIVPETYNFTLDLCVINLVLFAFNILPIFPLDGGRILLALLSKKLERKNALLITKTITVIISILLFLLFILSLFISINFSLGMMSVTLFISVVTEDKNAVYKKVMFLTRKQERIKKRGVEQKFVFVSDNISPQKLMKLLDAKHYTVFICVDENLNKTKVITEYDLIYNIKK